MKQFYTVVLDRLAVFEDTYESEPYEAGWADEVVAFVRVHELSVGARLSARIQISPDGIEWVDEGEVKDDIDSEGVYFLRTRNFGGWLRLVIDSSPTSMAKITTYLALKG